MSHALLLLPLLPWAVRLAVVDWRTHTLPTQQVMLAWLWALPAVALAAVIAHSPDWLLLAAAGSTAMGGIYFLAWFIYPRGLGFGDVRLAFVLGWCLGFAGLQPLVMGLYAPFILSILLMPLLALLRMVELRSFAFGPFMLLGSTLAVLSLAVPL